jgi:hypothetical protein
MAPDAEYDHADGDDRMTGDLALFRQPGMARVFARPPLATALSQQVGRSGSAPVDVTLGGYSGKKVELSVPATFSATVCEDRIFKTWLEAGAQGGDGGYVYGPSQHNTVYILDVNGTPLVLDTMYLPSATAADKAELQAILHSVSFEP